ncbi:hypothetical protein GOP47_0027185 [Adiantum capillus-veneris]|nr:hypothetical protein GOP47_0027185 [Adiantum capillus-veneris]
MFMKSEAFRMHGIALNDEGETPSLIQDDVEGGERIFFDEILLQIRNNSIAECRIYRKKHKMLDTSGDFFQRAGVNEELCYMRDIMEEEIQEDVNS